jgi:AraC family transcriptional regulator, regulatory protein of adaptative response / methylated-DNA-[protein]-cysteine methyltransferase
MKPDLVMNRGLRERFRRRDRAAATLADPRWAMVLARDARSDGTFFYSVATTGVYCRPSCASRPARPENVRFHATRMDAERAGFRPCKRCKPDQPPPATQHAAAVLAACGLIETADAVPSLSKLARHARLSARHFQRLFKTVTGLTPKAYAVAHRARRVRDALTHGRKVTDAYFDAGFGSSGRFYEAADAALGMTPSAYRAGGASAVIRFACAKCSLGAVLVAASDRGVCAILLGDRPAALARDLRRRFPHAQWMAGGKAFGNVVAKTVALVDTPSQGFDLPLDVRGTAFQHRVWQALRKIPLGSTASYMDIARRIGAPKAVRAVAGACAANTIAVAIPCHRVLRADGGLAGYRWGVARKRALLKREAGE